MVKELSEATLFIVKVFSDDVKSQSQILLREDPLALRHTVIFPGLVVHAQGRISFGILSFV